MIDYTSNSPISLDFKRDQAPRHNSIMHQGTASKERGKGTPRFSLVLNPFKMSIKRVDTPTNKISNDVIRKSHFFHFKENSVNFDEDGTASIGTRNSSICKHKFIPSMSNSLKYRHELSIIYIQYFEVAWKEFVEDVDRLNLHLLELYDYQLSESERNNIEYIGRLVSLLFIK